MLHSTKMVEAWTEADNFNRSVKIGTTVLHEDKEHKVGDVAFVLPSGQVVVPLEKLSSPVRLSNLFLTS